MLCWKRDDEDHHYFGVVKMMSYNNSIWKCWSASTCLGDIWLGSIFPWHDWGYDGVDGYVFSYCILCCTSFVSSGDNFKCNLPLMT